MTTEAPAFEHLFSTASPHLQSADVNGSPLGVQLLTAGLVSAEQLDSALQQQHQKKRHLGELLLEMGIVEGEQLLPFVAKQLGVKSVKLRDGLVDPKAVVLIPRAKAEAFSALAMFRVRDQLTVAMATPQDLRQIDEIERLTGLSVRPVLALRTAIETMLPRCYEEDFEVDAVTAGLELDAVEVHDDAITVDLQSADAQSDASPIVNLVNYMIVSAVRQGASDIHIEPSQRHSSVRIRVDGQLREVLRPRREVHPAIVSRIKVMAGMDIAERRTPQDGRVHVVVERREIDLRVSTLPTVLGEKVVLRVLDRKSVTFDLDRLGVPEQELDTLKRMLGRPFGLMLVTGPTGSGKTTTLYSAIELIKSIHCNIVTVEDPVEYQLELINQVQTGGAKSMTFANVLRSILRQDPDVIMVGEIRDVETAEVAIQAALTGHLVLSTLHTNDAAGAITRLTDMGIASYKLAAALVGVVAQRLVRTICPECRTPYYPAADFLEMLHYTGNARRQFTRGEGCATCYDTGFQGRIGIYEVMEATPSLREIIGHDGSLEAIRNCHREQGGTSLLNEGLRLAERGSTSLEEVARVALFD